MALSHAKSNTNVNMTGTVTVFNSAGITETKAATDFVRPIDWNSGHNEFITISGNTLNASTASGTNIIYQGAGNISLFATSDTLIFSGSQSVQTQAMVSLQGSTGAIVFSNSNNVSFGGNASTITASASFNQTVQTQGSVQVQGSTGAISFANGNGITFGGNASTITASHNGLTSQSNQAVSAANGSSAFQTLSFANGNGVTFATGVGGVGASVETSYAASNHSHGNPTLALTNLSGTTASNSAGLTLSLSAANPGGGAAFSAGLSGGNTSGNTGTVSNQIVFAGGNNITVSGSTNAGGMSVTISGANAGGAQTGISGIIVSDTTYTSGTVSFSNANGITFGSSAGQAITASHNGLTSQSNQAFSADASSTFQTLSFQNSNGVSFSNNAGALRVTHDLQFTSATSAITSNALHSSASRVINIVAATNNTGGGTASLSSNVSFSAANGITFYTSAGGAVVASHNGLTTARASNDAIGLNSAFTAGPLAMTINSSGLSLNAASAAGTTSGFTGGASISGSMTHNTAGLAISLAHPAWITTARASNDAIGLNSAFTAGPLAMTINSSGLSLNAASAAGTTSGFTGANISASITHNTAGLAMSMSVANPGGGGGAGLSAGTQSVSTGTVNFANSNGITFGMSNSNQITASYNSTQFAGTGTTFAGANISASMTLNSNGLNLSASVAAPGAAAENNNHNLLGANTAGNTTASGSTIGLSGLNLTLSGTNASQIVISAPATSSLVGASGISLSTNGSTISVYQVLRQQSFFMAMPANASTFASQVGNGTVAVYPVMREGPFTASRADIWASVSVSSSSNSSHAGVLSVYAGLYTRNGSTLSLASSGSQSYQWSNTSNNSLGSIASLRQFSIPFNVNYTGGDDLWVAVMSRSSTTNANWFTASNILQSSGGHSGQLVGLIGDATNATRGPLGFGRFSASSTALPSSMGFTQITGGQGGTASASRLMPNVFFQNFTA